MTLDQDDEAGAEALRAQVVEVLERSETAAQLVDDQDRLLWTSPQLRTIAGLSDAEELGRGERIDARTRRRTEWASVISDEAADALARQLAGSDSGPVWELPLRVTIAGQDQRLRVFGLEVRSSQGRKVGTVLVYSREMPAHVVAMLSRGDGDMFERMALLTEPAPRAAAVVFADLDSSARLSRQVSTQHYFEIIRAVTTAVDNLVTERAGIVGNHAGDGMNAFFLAEHCDGESGAARAALSLALALPSAVHAALVDLSRSRANIRPKDFSMNVGAHWGPDLHMGQVVVGGRLEITALGDAVNETARIVQVAHGGEVLASKALLERLDASDAEALGLDPAARSYEILGDLTDSDDKAQRDAGTLPVTRLLPAGEGHWDTRGLFRRMFSPP